MYTIRIPTAAIIDVNSVSILSKVSIAFENVPNENCKINIVVIIALIKATVFSIFFMIIPTP